MASVPSKVALTLMISVCTVECNDLNSDGRHTIDVKSGLADSE
jgi:hypothetical protein